MIKKILLRLIAVVIILASIGGIGMMTINNHVINMEKDSIAAVIEGEKTSLTKEEKEAVSDIQPQCAIIMGAGIQDEETPSPMLRDRLDVGIELHNSGVVSKLLLTGDNGTEGHNEIHVMLKYTRDAGIPEEDIYCDHAGFSTYDSMYRAKNIFGVERAVIVTQTYHEYRSLYIAEKQGMECIGASSDQMVYGGQPIREIREVLARVKDYFKCFAMPESALGGESISLSESGVISHGE